MTEPARIALGLDAAELGGAEVVAIDIASGFRGAGHDVVTVLPADCSPAVPDALRASGSGVVAVEGLARHSRRGVSGRIAAQLRTDAVDAIVVNLTDQGDGSALLRAARRSGKPAVVMLHLWIPGRARWRDRLSVEMLRGFPVAVPSRGTAELAAARGVAATVVPLAVHLPPLLSRDEARAELGIDPEATVIGGIGRLTEQKGWDVLVEAVAKLRARLPDVSVVVIGDGPMRDTLRSSGMAAGVRFLGSKPAAARWLRAFDVTAVPSRYESLGLAALESALAGVPVVASDVVGLREAVSGLGMLVPAEDPSEFADGLYAALVGSASVPRGERLEAAARARTDEAGPAAELLRLLGFDRTEVRSG